MDKNDLAISTITLARDEEEARLLTVSLQALTALGIPVYITDGGSSNSFVDFLHALPNAHVSAGKVRGLWAQAASSLQAAFDSGAPFLLYTEPDKHWFFEQILPGMLAYVQPSARTGIVLASRSPEGFSSFPAFQQMTETTINQCCAELIQKPVDYTYGPFLLRREIAPYVHLLKEDVGWGWRPFIFHTAKRLGYEVDAFEANLMCPGNQQQDSSSERVYRMRQLTQNIQGLVLSTQLTEEHLRTAPASPVGQSVNV